MKEIKSIPAEVKIFCPCGKSFNLVDRRIRTNGIVFGTIENVAKQYGIKLEELPFGLKLVAPKSRMQPFAEKLHFSGIPFKEIWEFSWIQIFFAYNSFKEIGEKNGSRTRKKDNNKDNRNS